jgi:hypothetical protein
MGHRHDHCGIWTGQADLRYRSGGTAINGCEVNCLAPRVKARIVADSSQEFGDRESQSDYRSRSKQLEGVLEQGGAFRSKGLYEGTPQVPSKPPFFRRPG